MAAVSLASTSQSLFNLTFFNEVTRSNETLYHLHANVIDSCIDNIVGHLVIREHHLIQKIPHYFDKTTSSKPDLSQSVTPVTSSLAKLSRVCVQPCTTCTPFMLQGYDNTLCSVTMKRPDRPLVPQERPESANPETPDEIIAMITFAGSPELQEQLRSLCREYIDIFSTSVRSLPAQVDLMVIEIDRTKWEVPRNRLPLDTSPLRSK